MSPLDNMFKMSLFFIVVQIRVIEGMVCEDIGFFQKIWEHIDEEQEEASLLDIKKYLQCCEDIDMGWINVCWGVPQVPVASTSLPHKVVFTLDKVVKQIHVSLFLA